MPIDLHLGDCMDGLRSLAEGSVDLIVTSPPFNLGGKFHSSYRDGTMVRYGDYGVFKDDMPEPEYQAWQVSVLSECHRVLKPAGSLYYQHKVRIKDGQAIHPVEWLLRSPFVLKQEVTIRFPGTVNNDKVRFLPFSERLYWLAKSPATKLLDERCAAYSDVWEIPHIKSRTVAGHPAAFDEVLPLRCILASSKPGDLVCDPFTGSGTVAVAAAGHGRSFVGWELDPKYFGVAQRRLTKVQQHLAL